MLHSTLRYDRLGPEMVGPGVAAFWHGDQLPLLGCLPRGSKVAPVSISEDGRLQARILQKMDIQIADGSSSRGGLRAAMGVLRGLRKNAVALIAVDGPRGPRHEPKPGAVFLAQRADTCIWPVSVAVSRYVRLSSTWDRYLLPAPFSRVVMYVGEPWCPPPDVPPEALCAELGVRIHQATSAAQERLSS